MPHNNGFQRTGCARSSMEIAERPGNQAGIAATLPASPSPTTFIMGCLGDMGEVTSPMSPRHPRLPSPSLVRKGPGVRFSSAIPLFPNRPCSHTISMTSASRSIFPFPLPGLLRIRFFKKEKRLLDINRS